MLRAWEDASSNAAPPAALDELVRGELETEVIRAYPTTDAPRREPVRRRTHSLRALAGVAVSVALVAGLASLSAWVGRPAATGTGGAEVVTPRLMTALDPGRLIEGLGLARRSRPLAARHDR
jgi:ferric-dicitrate binding protein FerR (iron transport regulator)